MHVEFLIIGQGISGTFLSYYLNKVQRSFIVIDDNDNDSPSRIAAGIINPVTGRRMVTVWMADEILPHAWKAYEEIGNELGINAISQKNIIDFFPNPFMRENFLKRLEEGNEYIQSYPDQDYFHSYFNFEFSCGEIRPVYTVHLETLLPAWRQQLIRQKNLWEEKFEIAHLKTTANTIHYKDIRADKIIFCDGPAGVDNPYFKQLPYALNKGEALIAEIRGIPSTHVFKKGMLLAPIQKEKDLFWIGSTYAWNFDNADPTKEFRQTTERLMKGWLKVPFTIIEHRAGLRPATLERRPFVGLHPFHKHAAILNGMGTKGCSLAPYFAKELAELLLHERPITAEADINRFQKILAR